MRLETLMANENHLGNVDIKGKTLLDYDMKVQYLKEEDRVYFWEGTGSNYSLAGFEMQFHRHTMKYIIDYYITSGLFVIVSWVRTLFVIFLRTA